MDEIKLKEMIENKENRTKFTCESLEKIENTVTNLEKEFENIKFIGKFSTVQEKIEKSNNILEELKEKSEKNRVEILDKTEEKSKTILEEIGKKIDSNTLEIQEKIEKSNNILEELKEKSEKDKEEILDKTEEKSKTILEEIGKKIDSNTLEIQEKIEKSNNILEELKEKSEKNRVEILDKTEEKSKTILEEIGKKSEYNKIEILDALKEIKILVIENNKMYEEIKILNEEKSEYIKNITRLESEIDQKGEILNIKKEKIEELDKLNRAEIEKNNQLKRKNEENEEIISNLKNEIEIIKIEYERKIAANITNKDSEILNISVENNKMKDAFEKINIRLITPHKELLNELYSCKRIVEYLVEIGLNNNLEDIDNYIILASMVNEFKLAEWVQKKFENNYKDYGYINAEEIKLINFINNFYKEKYTTPISWDVLFIPDGNNFDREQMRDVKNPNEMFRRFKGVFVPGLKTREGKPNLRAIVDGER